MFKYQLTLLNLKDYIHMENYPEKTSTLPQTKPEAEADKSNCENTAASSVAAQNLEEQSRGLLLRSARIFLLNALDNPEQELRLVDYKATLGTWITRPPSVIKYKETAAFGTESSSYFEGTSGWVKYKTELEDVVLTCKWQNYYLGLSESTYESSDSQYYLTKGNSTNGTDSTIQWNVKRLS